MRFASIGSGSKGNATLVESSGTCLMIDCGFSTKEVEKRMLKLSINPEDISAILVTHEHGDHVQGVARFSRKYNTPVWMTQGTYNRCRQRDDYPHLTIFSSHEQFDIQSLTIKPFPVPHDAAEPVQFVFSDADHQLGILTDTGTITPHIVEMLTGLDALILEGNYDHNMLMNGPYPQSLKARVSGRTGHLCNDQAAGLLKKINCENLQHLVAVHMSEKNNAHEHVMHAFSGAMGCSSDWIRLASQNEGFHWLEIVKS
ncbi:MAG: MBL fold metallo-hydrolase [Gammaproteobacteria bacterium]|nr:MBL fold metallo-hydrolase [Gammaproteobacteria bacterium]